MSRELDENAVYNSYLQVNEEEIRGLELNLEPNYTSYQSDQEEVDLQPIGPDIHVETPENESTVSSSEDENNEEFFLEENYNSFNRLLDSITVNYFNGGSNLLEINGFRINEDFEGILVIGDNIVVVEKN